MSTGEDISTEPARTEPEEAWLELLVDRLGEDTGPVRRLVRPRRGRIVDALATLVASRSEHEPAAPTEADIQSLIELIGLGMREREDSNREFAGLIGRAQAAGLDGQALAQVVQAYVRAVGRIVAVEMRLALDTLRQVEPERRPEVATGLLETLLPSSVRGFDLLHRAMLQESALEARETVTFGVTDLDHHAVGMADLVGSTAHLAQSPPGELERMVDALFAAGQAATSHRAAHVVKYVGDGVFIAGHDVTAVADAVADVVARLEAELPLRARGGVSYGPVVHRAGDIFGLPVNLSQALTKAASPGTVLLSEAATAQLARPRYGRVRQRLLPNPALGEQRVATLHGPDPEPADD